VLESILFTAEFRADLASQSISFMTDAKHTKLNVTTTNNKTTERSRN